MWEVSGAGGEIFCGFPQPAFHLFAERNSNLISSLGGVLDDQVVERSEAGWNLIASLLRCSRCTAVMLLGHWAEEKLQIKDARLDTIQTETGYGQTYWTRATFPDPSQPQRPPKNPYYNFEEYISTSIYLET